MNCRDTLIAELHKRSLQSTYKLLWTYTDWSNSDDPDSGIEALPAPLGDMVEHIQHTVAEVGESEATRVKWHIDALAAEKLTADSLVIKRFFDGCADIQELPEESINDLREWLRLNLPGEVFDLAWRSISDEWGV